ncbi:hypothetical protein MRX96_050526 [Rhipicephalus microplus]
MAHIGGQPLNQVTLRTTFLAADQGHNGAIDYRELQMALSTGTWRPFNMETARMLVHLFDRNHDGTINFDEFSELYRYVTDWSSAFRHFDPNNGGHHRDPQHGHRAQGMQLHALGPLQRVAAAPLRARGKGLLRRVHPGLHVRQERLGRVPALRPPEGRRGQCPLRGVPGHADPWCSLSTASRKNSDAIPPQRLLKILAREIKHVQP